MRPQSYGMRAWIVLALLSAVALSGCTDGGNDDTGPDEPDPQPPGDDAPVDDDDEPTTPPPGDAPTQDVTIRATGVYPFNPSLSPARVEVASGTMLTVTYRNEDGNPLVGHDIRFSGVEEQSPVIANGESTELTFLVDLEPGEYPYWCAVGNHREQGMEGVLVVT